MQLHHPSHEPPEHRRNGPGQGPAQQCPAPAAPYGSLTYPVAYLYLRILCHDYRVQYIIIVENYSDLPHVNCNHMIVLRKDFQLVAPGKPKLQYMWGILYYTSQAPQSTTIIFTFQASNTVSILKQLSSQVLVTVYTKYTINSLRTLLLTSLVMWSFRETCLYKTGKALLTGLIC